MEKGRGNREECLFYSNIQTFKHSNISYFVARVEPLCVLLYMIDCWLWDLVDCMLS